MEITTSLQNINSFGELNFESNEFESLNLSQIINSRLGNKSLPAEYYYADLIKNMWMIVSRVSIVSKIFRNT